MASWSQRSAFSRNQERDPTIKDLVEMLDLSDTGEFSKVRLIGPVFRMVSHQVEIHLKQASAKTGKMTTGFEKLCLNPNGEEGKTCPYCDAGLRQRVTFLQNVIDRGLQKRMPKSIGKPTAEEQKLVPLWDGGVDEEGNVVKPTLGRIKSKKSDYWTPVRVMRVPSTLAKQIVDASVANFHVVKTKSKKTGKTKSVEKAFGAEDPVYGFDMVISFRRAEKVAAQMYTGTKTADSKLTEAEKALPLWKLDIMKPQTLQAATKEMERLLPQLIFRDKDGKIITPNPDDTATSDGKSKVKDLVDKTLAGESADDDSDIDATTKKPAKKKKPISDKSVAKKPKKKREEQQEQQQEEARRPKKASSKKPSKLKKSTEAPVAKKPKKKDAVVKKKKRA